MNSRRRCTSPASTWRRLLATVVLCLAVGGNSASELLRIDRANFVSAGAADVGRDVGLPFVHTSTHAGDVSFRLDFAVDEPTDLAVHVTATSLGLEAWLNGALVYRSASFGDGRLSLKSPGASPSFKILVAQLRSGTNSLELRARVAEGQWMALDKVLVGAPAQIARLEQRRWLVHSVGPLAIASALGVVGLIALALWRGRHEFALMGLLGAGTTLWSLQTFLGLLPSPLLPAPHHGVFQIGLYAWFPLLLAMFFLRFAYRRSVWFERVAIAVMLLALPALYAGVAAGHFATVSLGLRGVVLLFVAIALWAVGGYAWHSRDTKGGLLLAAGALCFAAALRDYLISLESDDLKPVYLTTYTGVILVLLSAWMLLDRFYRAYAQFRDMNIELERRVQAANVELRERLAQTQAARDLAEQASMAKSRFFAAASHDLRQPMHSLGLFAAALREHVATEEGLHIARRIGDSVGSLDSLFAELLDISRIDAGNVTPHIGNVGLQALFDRLAARSHVEAVERGLRLRFVPTRLVVRSDPVLLERIVGNLVANALRYTLTGGVIVGARRRGETVRLEVIDSGIGIAAAQQSLVFEEFFQVDNPGRDRRRGLGLGLAIVERLCALLDHQVALRSAPGLGSRFCVSVPRSHQTPDRLDEAPPTVIEHFLRDVRVLIVDDELIVREGTETLLQQWQCIVCSAADGAGALHLLDAGFVPDIAIVDLRLGPPPDGIETIAALRRKLERELLAILISGETGTDELSRARSAGLTILAKPVSAAKLRSAMVALLHSQRRPALPEAATPLP